MRLWLGVGVQDVKMTWPVSPDLSLSAPQTSQGHGGPVRIAGRSQPGRPFRNATSPSPDTHKGCRGPVSVPLCAAPLPQPQSPAGGGTAPSPQPPQPALGDAHIFQCLDFIRFINEAGKKPEPGGVAGGGPRGQASAQEPPWKKPGSQGPEQPLSSAGSAERGLWPQRPQRAGKEWCGPRGHRAR